MKKKILILLSLLFFAPFVVNAYEVKMDFEKNYGGSNMEEFDSVALVEDGGFVAVGNTDSTDIEGLPNKGPGEAIIVKYDKDGNVLWQKNLGGNKGDTFNSISLTEEGGFIVAGSSSSTDIEGLPNKGNADAIIVKYDKDGNMLWQKSWGGNDSDSFQSVTLTEEGGFVAVGCSISTDIEGIINKGSNDAIIVKYDKEGNMLWQKNWGGSSPDDFSSVSLVEGGGFVAVGYTDSTDIEGITKKGPSEAIIVKYDKEGNMLWQKNWGGSAVDIFYSVSLAEDGGFVAVGDTNSTDIEGITNNGGNDSIIVKYDKEGNMLWQKSYGGNDNDGFSSIVSTDGGGFIAVGYSYSTDIEGITNNGYLDAIIVKYDKEGNMLWQKNWGAYADDWFNSVALTEDGGFVAVGRFMFKGMEGMTANGYEEAMVVKYSIEYNLEMADMEDGTSTVEQQGKYGVITPTPNEGYEVDKIIVKDKTGNVLDVELTKLEDGNYSFELYTDVSVEVLFKEILSNPKTGVFDYISFIMIGMLICAIGYISINYNNKKFEL